MSVACLNCQRLERDLQDAHAARERAIRGRETAVIHLENAEVELRAKRARVSELQAQLEAQLDDEPANTAAQAVFVYWRARCHPQAKSFKGKRRKVVFDRLSDKPEAYTVLDLMDAVDGAVVSARYPAMTELEYICRDPSITDNLRAAAAAHEAWQCRVIREGWDKPFQVTKEFISEGVELLAAQRAA